MGSKTYVDRDATINGIEKHETIPEWVKVECVKLLESLPSANVLEVVKCRNCEYFYELQLAGRYISGCAHCCGIKAPTPDSWCSYGERR